MTMLKKVSPCCIGNHISLICPPSVADIGKGKQYPCPFGSYNQCSQNRKEY